MVAHHVGHVLDRDLAGRFHEKRHFSVEVITHDIVEPLACGTGGFNPVLQITELPVAEDVECAPGTGVAAAGPSEIEGIVGVAEAEILVLSAEIALFACEGNHIGGIQRVLRIVQGETCYAALVGVCADISVRHAARYPYYAFIIRAFAHKVHHPGLLRVGDGKTLSFRRISVSVCKIHYRGDSLTGRAGTLESDIYEAAVVHDAVAVGKFLAASPGGLSYDELMLVHVPYGLVGPAHLGYFTQRLVAVPVPDGQTGPFAELSRRAEVQLAEKAMAVGCIGNHAGAVGAGALGDYHIGAGIRPNAGKAGRRCGGNQIFFHSRKFNN